jgi:hypothetical protein
MKNQIQLPLILILIILSSFEFTINAQIQDIKKNSNENKSNNSSNNNSNSSSSGSDDNSDFLGGCFGLFFDIFTGCLSSRPEVDNNNIADNPNEYLYNNEQNEIENNLNSVDSFNIKNQSYEIKRPADFSLDLKANFALGLEYSKEKTYKYYNFLPGVRANLAWFLIDYRYNILTEFSEDLPDAFKTWDLMFLFKINATKNTQIIFGTGMHREEYSSTMFNQHFLGTKIGILANRDYIDIEGRLTIDYSTEVFPFNELGIRYNMRIINAENLYGYFSFGGHYQNYYSSTDIWALQAGIILNWHK